MAALLSAFARTSVLRQMAENVHDLLVIGGGITGAGIALDAQTRGLATALVDMQDFAAGTSSRSTKLVHGGLRYLKQLEIGVVAEVGKERAVVYENGPHVTTPERMLLPIYEGGTFGRVSTSVGLRLYDFLAGVRKSERRVMLSRRDTLAMEPLLKEQGLKGGGYYVEYRTDDARLTLEVLKKAAELGAAAANYAQVERFAYEEDGRLCGAYITDKQSGETLLVRARRIVNAAGPWVDALRERDDSKKGKTLHLTKGVHLVFDGGRFPLRQAVYFDTPDGRMVFAIPRDGKTYVGTTDTFYNGELAYPRMTAEDRRYLLAAANGMFPRLGLTEADVESTWTGLRPLVHQEGKGPSEISRKDEIFVSPSGLVSIAGGKLTGYRKMAETVVDLVAKGLAQEGRTGIGPCRTRTLPLSGGDVGGSAGLVRFVRGAVRDGMDAGLPAAEAERLARRYGSNAGALFALAAAGTPAAPGSSGGGLPAALRAELDYAMECEMALRPVDFFIRRTGMLFFDIAGVRQWKEQVVAHMAKRLGWTPDIAADMSGELERELLAAVEPDVK